MVFVTEGRFGVTSKRLGKMSGAGEGIRTPDPLITNQMLYQLSYAGLYRGLNRLDHSVLWLSSFTVKN